VIDGAVRQGFEETKKRNQDFFARQAGNPSPPAGAITSTEGKPERPRWLETDSTSEVGIGDRVVAIGAPLGLESTVSEGIVSAVRDFGTTHVIQTTASISPGSSGGPLLNEYGKVVGITAATLRNGQNLNLAISSRHVATLLSQGRPMSLSAMLTETLVSDPVGQTTVFVPARQATTLQFVVAQQQGATLEGSYTISGGMGRDAGVWIVGPNNNVVVNSGRVSGYGQVKQKLAPGQYSIVFDNRFSMMSGKSISPDLRLVYYR
jgi:S1-C subfamily serine protease